MEDLNMTTPPRELIEQWQDESPETQIADHIQYLANRAAQWGADQELEACVEWISNQDWTWTSAQLRAARRPKLPSLKQQAQEALQKALVAWMTNKHDEDMFREYGTIINRALEQLPDD